MAQFIERNYVIPVMAKHNNAIALKKLWLTLFGVGEQNGVPVINRHLYFNGRSEEWHYGPGEGYTLGANNIRNDKTFVRFLSRLGSTHKKLAKENYDDLDDAYFNLDEKKLNFTPQPATSLKSKINSEYLSFLQNTTTAVHPTYTFFSDGKANDIVAKLPLDKELVRYKFLVNGMESSTTEDGYFSIDKNGVIRMTHSAITNEVQYFKYDSTNTHMYTVKKVLKDDTFTTTAIYLKEQREFVDIKITVGGQYHNKVVMPSMANRWITEDTVSSVPNAVAYLPELRAVIESNPLLYLGNMSDKADTGRNTIAAINRGVSGGIETSSASLRSAVGGIKYDEYNGHMYDALAILDDGTIFENVLPAFNETVSFQPIFDDGVRRGYNLEYTYTKRYKVKALATDISKIVTDMATASTWVKDSLANVFIKVGTTAPLGGAAATSAEDTILTSIVYALNSTGQDPADFIKGCLTLEAFNRMTPNEFSKLVSKCFTAGVTARKSKWYARALAIIIVVIGVMIVVLATPFVGIKNALMLAQLWYSVAGAFYAKHVGDAPGLKIIGAAAQINGIVLTVVSIAQAYEDIASTIDLREMVLEYSKEISAEAMDEFMTETAKQIAMSALSIAVSGVALAGQLGVGVNKDVANGLALLGAGMALSNGVSDMISNFGQKTGESLSATAFRNVSGFINNLGTTGHAYLALTNLMSNADTGQYSQDQGEIESDGVNRVYILQDKVYQLDALANTDSAIQTSFGLEMTRMVIAKQMM